MHVTLVLLPNTQVSVKHVRDFYQSSGRELYKVPKPGSATFEAGPFLNKRYCTNGE
jgi:hypothetical protein